MVCGVALGPLGIALLVLTSGVAGLPLGKPAGEGDALTGGCAGTPLVAVNDSMSVAKVVDVNDDSRGGRVRLPVLLVGREEEGDSVAPRAMDVPAIAPMDFEELIEKKNGSGG